MSGREDKKLTVPKFGSFKPQSEAAPGAVTASAPESRPPAEKEAGAKAHRDRYRYIRSSDSRREDERSRLSKHHRDHRGRRRSRSPDRRRDPTSPGRREHPSALRRSRSRERARERADKHSSLRDELWHGGEASKDHPAGDRDVQPFFIIDKRGDPLIRRYGTIDRSKVPRYRRYGRGKVLGSEGYLNFGWEGQRESFTISSHREGDSAFRDRPAVLAKVARIKARPLKIKPEPEEVGGEAAATTEDFLSLLATSRKRKRGDDESGSASEPEPPSYRSIMGKAKEHEFSDSELDYGLDTSDSSSEDGDEAFTGPTPARKKANELSLQVKESPDDIGSWLELIEIQDELTFGDNNVPHSRTATELQGLADLKLSLYQKALPHARLASDREKLHLGFMREAARLWDSKALHKKWQEISQENQDNFALWRARLDFELSDLATFTYDHLKDLQIQRMKYLSGQMRLAPAGADISSLCNQLIYFFLRMTRFIHDAGYTELAVASWQALLETTFARPPGLPFDGHNVADAVPASFQDFWESEVPRFGEQDAKGWRFFSENEGLETLPEASLEAPSEPTPATKDAYEAWAKLDTERTRKARMPARTLDAGADDDPFRVVLYADIVDLLFFVPEALISDVTEKLLDAFLLFCRLPPAFGTSDLIVSAWDDPFVQGGSISVERDGQKLDQGHLLGLEESSTKKPPFLQDGARLGLSPEVLFAGTDWFRYLAGWSSGEDMDAPVDRGWVLRAVRQLTRQHGVGQLANYSLAMEWLEDPGSARKAARALLKQFPDNVALYNAYALTEWGNGNADVARKVLLAAGRQTWSDDNPTTAQLLWNTLAWIELESGRKLQALASLCSATGTDILTATTTTTTTATTTTTTPTADASPIPISRLLQSRHALQNNCDRYLSRREPDKVIEFTKALVMLEYLTAKGGTEPSSDKRQGNISAAMVSTEAFSRELRSRGLEGSAAHEVILQFSARLLYFHANNGPYRPRYLRDQLLGFIHLFPRNAAFLSLFAWTQTGLRIDDPVREVLRDTVLRDEHDGPGSRILAIAHELRAGNAHSARDAFEQALAGPGPGGSGGGGSGEGGPVCRASAALWKAYIRFCYAHRRELRRGAARDAFYLAAGACPWSRDLVMEAFVTLGGDMDSSELRSVFNTITAKGLRVHVELDEFVEQWGPSQGSNKPAGSRAK